MSHSSWQPVHEPLSRTLLRTGLVALIGGIALGHWWGGAAAWTVAVLALFCFSFGGHWVELFFLNWLSPRLPPQRPLQLAVRVLTWFVGGCVLGAAASLTMRRSQESPGPLQAWWSGGVALIAIEVVVHGALYLRKGGISSTNVEQT